MALINTINFLVFNLPESSGYLRVILDNAQLNYPIEKTDINGKSLFQEIIDSDFSDKSYLFQSIYQRGYITKETDREYIKAAIKNILDYNSQDQETILIAFCYIKIKNKSNYTLLREIYREVSFLLCLKFRTIIHFKFKQMVQVANNALEHYNGFGSLFLNAIDHYGFIQELSEKASFNKKIENYNINEKDKLKQYHDLFKNIFPELF